MGQTDTGYTEQLSRLMSSRVQEACHLSTDFSDSSTGAVLTAEPARGCLLANPGTGCGVSRGSLNRALCTPASRLTSNALLLFSAAF